MIQQACCGGGNIKIKPMPKKAPPPIPPDDEQLETSAAKPPQQTTNVVAQAITAGRKAPPAFATPTPVQHPPPQTTHTMPQHDHDPWNDRDDHGQDPVIEVLTPAVAIARTPSPARPQQDIPQLGSNPRLAAPHLLPQQTTSAYTPWQDSFSPPTPCPPAPLPTTQPLQPLQPLHAQSHNIHAQYATEVIPRSVPTTSPPQFMGTYHDGRPPASSLVPIRGLIPTSLDGGAAPPNPMPPAAWGYNGNNLPCRVATIHHHLPTLQPIPPREVQQFPPGNYPYLAFADDAPWLINTSMLLAMESALDYHLLASRTSIFGLILDAPNAYRPQQAAERVLWMPLPSPGTDVLTMVTQSYMWSLMTGAIAAAGHQNAERCYQVVRDFMTFAVYIRRFPQGHPAADRWITVLSDAILDCSCYTLPISWRQRFCEDWQNHVYSSGQPARLYWRRGS